MRVPCVECGHHPVERGDRGGLARLFVERRVEERGTCRALVASADELRERRVAREERTAAGELQVARRHESRVVSFERRRAGTEGVAVLGVEERYDRVAERLQVRREAGGTPLVDEGHDLRSVEILGVRLAALLVEHDWALLHLNEWNRERQSAGAPFTANDPGWLESRTALAQIVRVTRAQGAHPVFFMWNLGRYPPGDPALARLRENGRGARGPRVRHGAAVRAVLGVREQRVHGPDPNAAGHERLAAEVARVLREAGWVPAAP